MLAGFDHLLLLTSPQGQHPWARRSEKERLRWSTGDDPVANAQHPVPQTHATHPRDVVKQLLDGLVASVTCLHPTALVAETPNVQRVSIFNEYRCRLSFSATWTPTRNNGG